MTTVRSGDVSVSDSSRKLVSWKAIAEYFECDVRTVKRWESERGLPVHRAPGGKRGYVFAYGHELDKWLRTVNPRKLASEPGEKTSPVPGDLVLTTSIVVRDSTNKHAEQTSRQALHLNLAWWWALGTTCGALLLTIVLVFWTLQSRNAVGAKSSRISISSLAIGHVPAPEAQELYLRGRYFWNLRTADSLSKAIDAFTQAIVKDPSYAEPYAGLAETYELMPQFAHADLSESFERAKRAAGRAIDLDPNLVAAHRAQGFALFFWDWDITGSDAEFKRALALDPSSAETHHWYASTLFHRLEGRECINQIEEALRLNPTSAAIAADAAFFKANFGNLNDGIKALKEIERTQPTLSSPAHFLSDIEFAKGNFPAYIEEVQLEASITHDPYYAGLGEALARGWNRSGKLGLLKAKASNLKVAFSKGTERGFLLGETLVLLGRTNEALPYFWSAFLNYHDMGLVFMRMNPQATSLLKNPAYAALFADVDKQFHGSRLAYPATLPVAFRMPQ